MVAITQEDKDFYEENGYLVVKNFFTPEEVKVLKEEIKKLILENPDNEASKEKGWSHRLGQQRFLDSIKNATLFFEDHALDETGKLVIPIEQAVHKIQAGCHLFGEETKKAVFSDKMKQFVRDITSFKEPKVIQTMYLLKQPNIGAAQAPHQDEMYLTTTPAGKVFGIWVALDDATEENGCLDFIPGSHKTVPCTRFYVRTGATNEGAKLVDYEGEADYLSNPDPDKYVRCPVKSGDLVLIHGLVVHKSGPNTSGKPRAAFSFHGYETAGGVAWSPRAWCQESDDYKFMSLY